MKWKGEITKFYFYWTMSSASQNECLNFDFFQDTSSIWTIVEKKITEFSWILLLCEMENSSMQTDWSTIHSKSASLVRCFFLLIIYSLSTEPVSPIIGRLFPYKLGLWCHLYGYHCYETIMFGRVTYARR